ncbi:redoxin domain-containing protein, partial [Candidatus Pelagibacter bacterium]
MALTKTPVCDFGKKAEEFKLKSINNEIISLDDIRGDKATLIMFICNHCPYVKAIIKDLAKDCSELKKEGINSVAIMSNDTNNYPEDSFENMIKFAKSNDFGETNYLIDETQEIAKKYEAVCTPDFFG